MKDITIRRKVLIIFYIFMCIFPVRGAINEETEANRRKFLEEKGISKKSIDYFIEAIKIEGVTDYQKRRLLELSIEEDRRNDMSYMALGAWWYFKSNYVTENMRKDFLNKALENYKIANKLTSTPVSFGLVGKIYFLLEEYEEAEKIFDRMIKEIPDSSLGYYGKALLEINRGNRNFEKSLEYLIKTEELYEKDKGWGGVDIGRVKLFKILIYKNMGNYEKAFNSFYEGYPVMADEFTERYLSLITEFIVKMNNDIEKTYPELYKRNIRKFKELDMID